MIVTNEFSVSDLDSEINEINRILNLQKKLRLQLKLYMDKLTIGIDNISINADLNSIYKLLENFKNSFDSIDKNISEINKLLDLLNTLKQNNDISSEEIYNYNQNYSSIHSSFLEISSNIYSLVEDLSSYIHIIFEEQNSVDPEPSVTDISETENSNITNNIEENTQSPDVAKDIESSSTNITLDNDLKENTLVISEKMQKVFLPYTQDELNEKLKKDEECQTLQDIIEKYYVLPLSTFKNSSVARFREAFNLIKNKEKGNIKDGFELGLELFFNYNLNPAIITACKNIDELDIYLSCLEDNELDKFNCFNIVYEYMPTVVKSSKNKH